MKRARLFAENFGQCNIPDQDTEILKWNRNTEKKAGGLIICYFLKKKQHESDGVLFEEQVNAMDISVFEVHHLNKWEFLSGITWQRRLRMEAKHRERSNGGIFCWISRTILVASQMWKISEWLRMLNLIILLKAAWGGNLQWREWFVMLFMLTNSYIS